MYLQFVSLSTAVLLVGRFILLQAWIYFRDGKRLRKYPSLNRFAGFTDLGFMYEAHKGFRTQVLTEMHKRHRIVRIGPNSLSVTGVDAIKVSNCLTSAHSLYLQVEI